MSLLQKLKRINFIVHNHTICLFGNCFFFLGEVCILCYCLNISCVVSLSISFGMVFSCVDKSFPIFCSSDFLHVRFFCQHGCLCSTLLLHILFFCILNFLHQDPNDLKDMKPHQGLIQTQGHHKIEQSKVDKKPTNTTRRLKFSFF
jgi:hypothetical protein